MGQAFGRRSGQDEPIRGPMTGLARRALSASSDPIDLLDDALTDLRVSGCVLLHEAYAPGWAISVPGEASLRAMMGAAAGMRAMAFHLVRRGRCEILAGTDAMVLMESDLSLMVGGARHRLSDGGGGEAIPLEALLADRGRLAGALDAPGATELVCGVFLLRASPLNPLLGQLPTVLQVSAGGGGGCQCGAGGRGAGSGTRARQPVTRQSHDGAAAGDFVRGRDPGLVRSPWMFRAGMVARSFGAEDLGGDAAYSRCPWGRLDGREACGSGCAVAIALCCAVPRDHGRERHALCRPLARERGMPSAARHRSLFDGCCAAGWL